MKLSYKYTCISCSMAIGLLVGTLNPTRLAGQATELGTIVGTVTDPQTSAVPGAKVTVTNAGTGVVREVTTDNQGNFAARSLVPGTYSVEVTAPSFQKQLQSNIKLDVGATVTLDQLFVKEKRVGGSDILRHLANDRYNSSRSWRLS